MHQWINPVRETTIEILWLPYVPHGMKLNKSSKSTLQFLWRHTFELTPTTKFHESTNVTHNGKHGLISQYNVLYWCFFCIYREVFHFFSCKNFIIFSLCRLQSTLRLFDFDMHSNAKTPVTLCNYKPGAWVLYARVTDQSKANIFIQPGIMFVVQVYIFHKWSLGQFNQCNMVHLTMSHLWETDIFLICAHVGVLNH